MAFWVFFGDVYGIRELSANGTTQLLCWRQNTLDLRKSGSMEEDAPSQRSNDDDGRFDIVFVDFYIATRNLYLGIFRYHFAHVCFYGPFFLPNFSGTEVDA